MHVVHGYTHHVCMQCMDNTRQELQHYYSTYVSSYVCNGLCLAKCHQYIIDTILIIWLFIHAWELCTEGIHKQTIHACTQKLKELNLYIESKYCSNVSWTYLTLKDSARAVQIFIDTWSCSVWNLCENFIENVILHIPL